MVRGDAARRPRPGRSLRSATSAAIAEAAFSELAVSGYAGTSMEGVARRAGVGKASVYRRWPDKAAMIANLVHNLVVDSLPPVPNKGSLGDDVRTLMRAYRAQLREPGVRSVGLRLLSEVPAEHALAEIVRSEVTLPRRDLAHVVVAAAVERGEVAASTAIAPAIDLLIAPLAFRLVVLGEEVDDEHLESLVLAVLAALGAPAN